VKTACFHLHTKEQNTLIPVHQAGTATGVIQTMTVLMIIANRAKQVWFAKRHFTGAAR